MGAGLYEIERACEYRRLGERLGILPPYTETRVVTAMTQRLDKNQTELKTKDEEIRKLKTELAVLSAQIKQPEVVIPKNQATIDLEVSIGGKTYSIVARPVLTAETDTPEGTANK